MHCVATHCTGKDMLSTCCNKFSVYVYVSVHDISVLFTLLSVLCLHLVHTLPCRVHKLEPNLVIWFRFWLDPPSNINRNSSILFNGIHIWVEFFRDSS